MTMNIISPIQPNYVSKDEFNHGVKDLKKFTLDGFEKMETYIDRKTDDLKTYFDQKHDDLKNYFDEKNDGLKDYIDRQNSAIEIRFDQKHDSLKAYFDQKYDEHLPALREGFREDLRVVTDQVKALSEKVDKNTEIMSKIIGHVSKLVQIS